MLLLACVPGGLLSSCEDEPAYVVTVPDVFQSVTHLEADGPLEVDYNEWLVVRGIGDSGGCTGSRRVTLTCNGVQMFDAVVSSPSVVRVPDVTFPPNSTIVVSSPCGGVLVGNLVRSF